MPRPPGIQFAGANYHIVTRGDGRQSLLHDDGHYGHSTDGHQLTFGDSPPTAGAQLTFGDTPPTAGARG